MSLGWRRHVWCHHHHRIHVAFLRKCKVVVEVYLLVARIVEIHWLRRRKLLPINQRSVAIKYLLKLLLWWLGRLLVLSKIVKRRGNWRWVIWLILILHHVSIYILSILKSAVHLDLLSQLMLVGCINLIKFIRLCFIVKLFRYSEITYFGCPLRIY